MHGIILDLDQTLLNTTIAEPHRRARNWRKVYDLIPMFEPYENLIEIVANQIGKGLSSCIVTNSPESYCRKVVDYWSIPVSSMVCYHDTRRHKPDPEPFMLALERMKLRSNYVISFGDKNEDIIASKRARVDSVFCAWGADESSTNVDATYFLDRPEQVNDVMEQWINGKN